MLEVLGPAAHLGGVTLRGGVLEVGVGPGDLDGAVLTGRATGAGRAVHVPQQAAPRRQRRAGDAHGGTGGGDRPGHQEHPDAHDDHAEDQHAEGGPGGGRTHPVGIAPVAPDLLLAPRHQDPVLPAP